MIARTRLEQERIVTQSLREHCETVAALCGMSAEPIGLSHAARLAGVLHDMGKATRAFEEYLRECVQHPQEKIPPCHNHAPTGAIFAYERWFKGDVMHRLTAQMAALCVLGHHAGLTDCLEINGASPFLEVIRGSREALCYQEATENYLRVMAAPDAPEAFLNRLDALFEAACGEVQAAVSRMDRQPAVRNVEIALLTRLLLSMVVDADRWDSACFERGCNALEQERLALGEARWHELFQRFEAFRRENLSGEGELNALRAHISNMCLNRAGAPTGIVTLTVPTGGGKTFSSLRYALRHAEANGQARIFYIIPYNTILDQNAQDIRGALAEDPCILEHHSNVVCETQEEQTTYKRLTERWESRIILTSLVQFLNACFAEGNTDARRMHRLTNAVLIFDEIQSLPIHCKGLFERAVLFLTQCCHCTVVLCTATQPSFELLGKPMELMEDVDSLYASLRRVRYLPQLKPPKTFAEAAVELAAMARERSVLMIANTKKAAWNIFERARALLRDADCSFAEVRHGLSDVGELARSAPPQQMLCLYLSTHLCPAHRKELLAWVKAWLRAGRRVLCVSTALIEAGINVSFPVVVRSLAGLPSVIQAGGRANRNREWDVGEVYLWYLAEEQLQALPDLQNGGLMTRGLIEASGAALDTPEAIRSYNAREALQTKEAVNGPMKKDKRYKGLYMVDLLAGEKKCVLAARLFKGRLEALVLRQSFRAAARNFEVIDSNTRAVLVPFGEGAKLMEQLNTRLDLQQERWLLRKAQQYTVNLYSGEFQRLMEMGALYPLGETNVWVLDAAYYDEQGGVMTEAGERGTLII